MQRLQRRNQETLITLHSWDSRADWINVTPAIPCKEIKTTKKPYIRTSHYSRPNIKIWSFWHSMHIYWKLCRGTKGKHPTILEKYDIIYLNYPMTLRVCSCHHFVTYQKHHIFYIWNGTFVTNLLYYLGWEVIRDLYIVVDRLLIILVKNGNDETSKSIALYNMPNNWESMMIPQLDQHLLKHSQLELHGNNLNILNRKYKYFLNITNHKTNCQWLLLLLWWWWRQRWCYS